MYTVQYIRRSIKVLKSLMWIQQPFHKVDILHSFHATRSKVSRAMHDLSYRSIKRVNKYNTSQRNW